MRKTLTPQTRIYEQTMGPLMLSRMLQMLLRPFWRMTRGLTLGTQGIVIDDDGRVLLVRHGYRPGWHFAVGGVEWGETVEVAWRRELEEEAGVIVGKTPELHGLFANFEKFPGDHIALFIVRDWQRPQVPSSNMEIRESRFFSLEDLPEDVTPAAGRRLAEIFSDAEQSQTW